jgi:hypothetical protein
LTGEARRSTARPRRQRNRSVLVLSLVVVLSEEFKDEGEDDDEDAKSLRPEKKTTCSGTRQLEGEGAFS